MFSFLRTRSGLPLDASPQRPEAPAADTPNLHNLPSVVDVSKPEELKKAFHSWNDLTSTREAGRSTGEVVTLMEEILQADSPRADDAADALVGVATFPEMDDCLAGCGVYQFLLQLSSAMPSGHVRCRMMQLISILQRVSPPSEAPVNNWWARRQYDSMLVRAFHQMAAGDVSSSVWTLDQVRLLRLIRNALSYRYGRLGGVYVFIIPF